MHHLDAHSGHSAELLNRAGLLASRRMAELQARFGRNIDYNDRLAAHWQPGIPTRAAEIEDGERAAFLDLAASEWLARKVATGRPSGRALVIDLGGGTGRVLDWLEPLRQRGMHRVTYLYTDISTKMLREAERRFAAMHPGASSETVQARFLQADATRPLFTRAGWSELRRSHCPILTVCAGGTIGNFGEVVAMDDAAQLAALEHYAQPADAALVTFLDPLRIDLSLEAYREFGLSSGMYDGQLVHVFSTADGAVRVHEPIMVPFGAGYEESAAAAVHAVYDLRRNAVWLKLDMLQGDQLTGQVTRHYSRRRVTARFLAGTDVREIVPCHRGLITVFAHERRPGD